MEQYRGGRSIYRAIDANANRCREGLRVAEDYARFVLDDAGLVTQLKELRHEVTDTVKLLGDESLLVEARDTEGDVGTRISVPQETKRATEEDVLKSALKRSEEALRVLEEFGKMVRPDIALRFEVIRYRLYTIEQDMLTRRLPERKIEAAKLCMIVSEEGVKGALEGVVQAAVDGGVDMVVYREDGASSRRFLEKAHALRALCASKGVPFIVKGRTDISVVVDADGVHLSEDDIPVDAARKVLGRNRIIGLNAASMDDLRAAMTSGIQYLFVNSKLSKQTPTGFVLPLFVVAENEEAVAKVVKSGAKRIAVGRAIGEASDPATAAGNIKALLCQEEGGK